MAFRLEKTHRRGAGADRRDTTVAIDKNDVVKMHIERRDEDDRCKWRDGGDRAASLAFFSTRTRKGSSWEFLRQQERMYDQDGKPSATIQWTMEVFRGTAEWEYGRYVGAAAQRTAISTARWPDRLGQAQDSAR